MTPFHLDDERIQRQLEGLLAGADEAQARAHLEACADCRLLADAHRALASALDGLAAVPVPAGFTDAVMARIEAREQVAGRERLAAAAILAAAFVAGAALLAGAGSTAWAPVITRAGDLLGSLIRGLALGADVAAPIFRALRLEIVAASAGAAIPLLVALRRLAPRRAEVAA